MNLSTEKQGKEDFHSTTEQCGLCRYNLGHHMLPSNKFLLYDHSLRIPMVIMGPGIPPNSANEFLGTQVCEHLFELIHIRDKQDECATDSSTIAAIHSASV